jgi:acyl CoA:acetate/3-ketoacid CoA transferase alpha subunit
MPDPINTTCRQCGWRITVQSLHPDQIAANHKTVLTLTESPRATISEALRAAADSLDFMFEPFDD